MLNIAVRPILPYGCEAWPREFGVSVAWPCWMLAVYVVLPAFCGSNAEVLNRLFGTTNSSLKRTILQNRLRWLGRILKMRAQRLPFPALFGLPGSDWKKRSGGQAFSRRGKRKELIECLSRLGQQESRGPLACFPYGHGSKPKSVAIMKNDEKEQSPHTVKLLFVCVLLSVILSHLTLSIATPLCILFRLAHGKRYVCMYLITGIMTVGITNTPVSAFCEIFLSYRT